MKMEKRENLESFDEQERRAQQEMSPKAMLKAALLAGMLVFVMPAGPWMSQESMVNVMGRGMGTQAILAFFAHFALVFLYAWVIAVCIFRLPPGAGIGFGALLALPLWGLNYPIFAAGAGFQANEMHAAIAHLMFCLFFSVAYRGSRSRVLCAKDGAEQGAGSGGEDRRSRNVRDSSGLQRRLLTHVESAVHVQDVAGDVARHRRGEKQRRVDDLRAPRPKRPSGICFLKFSRHFIRHALCSCRRR